VKDVGELAIMPDDDCDPATGVEISADRDVAPRSPFETRGDASQFTIRELARPEHGRDETPSTSTVTVRIVAGRVRRDRSRDTGQAESELPTVVQCLHYRWH